MKYLNQFLPPEHNMRYIHIDMARINKRQGERGKRGGSREEERGKREGSTEGEKVG